MESAWLLVRTYCLRDMTHPDGTSMDRNAAFRPQHARLEENAFDPVLSIVRVDHSGDGGEGDVIDRGCEHGVRALEPGERGRTENRHQS